MNFISFPNTNTNTQLHTANTEREDETCTTLVGKLKRRNYLIDPDTDWTTIIKWTLKK